MDRELSSPNFNAARARRNSSSRVSDYYFSATSHRYRNVEPTSYKLPPLHPISTAHEVACSLVPEHCVPSPTTVCESPRRDDAIESALSQMSIAFASLGAALRRPDAQRNANLSLVYGVSDDAVPQPAPIPTQTSLPKPATQVDNAVENALGQRLAQPLPTAAPATTNPPQPLARPEWDPKDRDLLFKSAN